MELSEILNAEYGKSLILDEDPSKLMVYGLNRARAVKIPMIIMQTWKDENIPRKWKASRNAIETLMPDWKYFLMTDADNLKFVKKYFPDFLHYFNSFEYPIQRADAIRYMWFYVHGGVYLDLDLEALKSFDDLFYEDRDLYVVKSANFENVYTNAFMAAKPRLRVMLQCLEEMKSPYAAWHVGKHLKVVNSTGPNMFTKAINKVREKFQLREDDFKIKELPTELIVACTICDPKPCCSENGYFRTLGGSSWGADTNFTTLIFCNRYQLGTVILIIIIIITIAILLRRKKSK